MAEDGMPHDQRTELNRLSLLWGKSTPDDATQVSVSLRKSGPVECWRGIRDSSMFMWTAKAEGSENFIADVKARLSEPGQRTFDTLRTWGDAFDPAVSVANAVLRELQPGADDSILPKLYRQIEAVIARPGCRGNYLGAQVGAPSNMLGITLWSEVESFEQYMKWAVEQPWSKVISPVTISVPLRLLVERFMG
jgi:hypothetical protein